MQEVIETKSRLINTIHYCKSSQTKEKNSATKLNERLLLMLQTSGRTNAGE